jgi:predicted transcriptional regulator
MSNLRKGYRKRAAEEITFQILRCVAESDKKIASIRKISSTINVRRIISKYTRMLVQRGLLHRLTENETMEYAKHMMIQTRSNLFLTPNTKYKPNPHLSKVRKYVNNPHNGLKFLYTITEEGMKFLNAHNMMQVLCVAQ